MRLVLAVYICWLFLASTSGRILSTILFDTLPQQTIQTLPVQTYQFTVVSTMNIEISLTRITPSTSSYVLMCSSLNQTPSIINYDINSGKMSASADKCDYLNNQLNSISHYSFFSNFQLTQGDTIYISVFLNQQQTYSESYTILVVSSFFMLCPNTCSSHGTCSGIGQCLCNNSYSKDDCSVQVTQIQKNIARTVTLSNNSQPSYIVLDFSNDYFQDSSVSYVAVSIVKAVTASNSPDIDIMYLLVENGSNDLPTQFNNLQKQTLSSSLIMIYFLKNEVATSDMLVIALSQTGTASTIQVQVSATEEKGILNDLSSSFVIIFVCSIVSIFIIGFLVLFFCYVRKKRSRQIANIINISPTRNTNRVSPNKLTLGSDLLNKCMPVMKYQEAVELLEQTKKDQLKASLLMQQEKQKLTNFSSAPMLIKLNEFPVDKGDKQQQIITESARVNQIDKSYYVHENGQNISAVQDLSQSIFQNNFTDAGGEGGEECVRIKQESNEVPVDLKDKNSNDQGQDSNDVKKEDKDIIVNGETGSNNNKNSDTRSNKNKVNSDQNEGAPTCAVCLGEFLPTDEVRISICEHIFHRECLESWLKKQENCPLCRKEFLRSNLQEWFKTKQRQILKVKRILTLNSCSSPSKDKADSLILNKLGATSNSVRNIFGQSMCNQSDKIYEGQQQNSISMSYNNYGGDFENYSMRDQGSQWKNQIQVLQQTREFDQFNQSVIQEEEEEKRDNNNILGENEGRISRTIDVFDGYGFSRREKKKEQILPVSQSTNNPRFMQQFSIKRQNNIRNQVSKSSSNGIKIETAMAQSHREMNRNMNEMVLDNERNDKTNVGMQNNNNEIRIINGCEVERINNQQGEQNKLISSLEGNDMNIPEEFARLERDKGVNDIDIFYGKQQSLKNNILQQMNIIDGDRNKKSVNEEKNYQNQEELEDKRNQDKSRIIQRDHQQELVQYNSIDLSSQSNEQIEQIQKQQQQQGQQTDQSELMPIDDKIQ